MPEQAEMLQILVVDDSAVSRKLAELAFLGRPYVVHFAEDGRQALDQLEKKRPDIVVTDWMMPDLSGLDLCKRIRSRPGLRDTYVILLSSNSTEEQKAAGFAAGADGYLTKPLQAHELLGQIRTARGVLEARRKEAEKRLSGLARV